MAITNTKLRSNITRTLNEIVCNKLLYHIYIVLIFLLLSCK